MNKQHGENMENNMNNFADLYKKFTQDTRVKSGSIINATVIFIDNNNKYVVVDIYSKSECKVSFKEFDKIPEIGESIALYVVNVDDKGETILSHKRAKKEMRKQQLEEAKKNKTIIEGSIIGKNYSTPGAGSFNGYKVNLGDIVGLLPKSQIHGFDRIKDKENFNNEKYEFMVTNIDEIRDTINLVMLDEEMKKYNFKDPATSKIKEKDNIDGKVIAIEDYGVYLLINDEYLGFVKINDLSANKRIEHPSEILSLGEVIKTKIVKAEANRFKCSLALLDTNNLEDIKLRFKVGNIYKAKITSIINHGCYVFLDDGLPLEAGKKKKRIDGFIEASEMAWNESEFYKNKFKIGDTINVKILSADDIIVSASCKQCNTTPFEKFCQQFQENSTVSVTINNTFRSKAIGEIVLDDNSIISGLMDKREFDWDFNAASSEFNKIKNGTNHQFNTKIIRINKENYQIDLSIRKLFKDPIDEFMEKYSPSSAAVEAEINYVGDNHYLLSVDKWRNILILYKSNDMNFKLKSKVKVNIGKLDKKSKYDRHIMAFLADKNKKGKESFNNSLSDNITIEYN
jgi:small subunit ribosomal protein S1